MNYDGCSLPFGALRKFCEEGTSLPPPVPLFVTLPDGGGDGPERPIQTHRSR
jgi:hypothetical protein